MDKSKYKMVGMLFGCPGHDTILIKFMGNITIDKLLEIIGDEDFNEYHWLWDLHGMLDGHEIPYVMCTAETVTDPLGSYMEKGMDYESKYTTNISSAYDIFIEAISIKNNLEGEDESIQHIYVFSDEWQYSKRIDHIAGISENETRFWDETYVSCVFLQDNSIPKYNMDAKMSGMDKKRCVAYYDRFLMLKYISNIDDCNSLRDYVEDETKERLENSSPI